eukprot:scpid13618/ scgid12924/ 
MATRLLLVVVLGGRHCLVLVGHDVGQRVQLLGHREDVQGAVVQRNATGAGAVRQVALVVLWAAVLMVGAAGRFGEFATAISARRQLAARLSSRALALTTRTNRGGSVADESEKEDVLQHGCTDKEKKDTSTDEPRRTQSRLKKNSSTNEYIAWFH